MPMRWRWPPENSCGNRHRRRDGEPIGRGVSDAGRRSRAAALPSRNLRAAPSNHARSCGSSEPNGSWNTICMSRRWGRIARRRSKSIARRRATPRLRSARAGRSSSLPSVSSASALADQTGFCRAEHEIHPSTARNMPRMPRNPRRTGKCFVRLRTSRRGGFVMPGPYPRGGRRTPGRRPLSEERARRRGTIRREGAPRGERATRDRSSSDGTTPGISASRRRASPARPAEARHRPQQRPRIGMARAGKDRVDGPLFHLAAGIHDHDAVGHFGDDAEIVGDEEDGRSEAGLEHPG